MFIRAPRSAVQTILVGVRTVCLIGLGLHRLEAGGTLQVRCALFVLVRHRGRAHWPIPRDVPDVVEAPNHRQHPLQNHMP